MKNILIADDNTDCSEAISDLLEYEEYYTIQASDGVEALAFLSQMIFDLLITDIMMPKMGGIELSGEARCKYPNMKCILMSGGVADDKEHDLKSYVKEITGIEYFIKKPCNPIEMITLVNQLLDD